MLHRWGPNVKEMMAIKKYLATQSISFNHPPWVRHIQIRGGFFEGFTSVEKIVCSHCYCFNITIDETVKAV
jgi:hypothetical protein